MFYEKEVSSFSISFQRAQKTYLGYLIGMTTASLRRRFAVSKPLMLSHLTSGLPRMISL
jgi:hypothetical protein